MSNLSTSMDSVDYEEAQRQAEEKMRHLGWILLSLWTFVICYVTKEYWFPSIFAKDPGENDSNLIFKIRAWKNRSKNRRNQRQIEQAEIIKKRRQLETLQKIYFKKTF